MTDFVYCPKCQKNVTPKVHINWIVFIILFVFLIGIVGLIYLAYCFVSSNRRKCSVCGNLAIEPPRFNMTNNEPSVNIEDKKE